MKMYKPKITFREYEHFEQIVLHFKAFDFNLNNFSRLSCRTQLNNIEHNKLTHKDVLNLTPVKKKRYPGNINKHATDRTITCMNGSLCDIVFLLEK